MEYEQLQIFEPENIIDMSTEELRQIARLGNLAASAEIAYRQDLVYEDMDKHIGNTGSLA